MIGDKKAPSKDYVSLNVAEAQQDDVNKGIVRIDSEIMKDIGLNQGDIVEIQGERKTSAISGRAFPSDLGLNIIRMDPLARRNAKTSIGEKVKIKKLEFTPAKSVTLAPVKGRVIIQGDFSGLKRSLLGRALSKGDLISMGGTKRRRTAFSGSPFEDIFDQLLSEDNSGMFGGFGLAGIRMMVVNTNPKEPCVITEDTRVEWKDTPVELKEESIPEIAYEDIGGLEEEIKKVREMIELPMKHPEIFERLGVQPPKGVLLYGPPGTGKTLLAKAVAHESQANFVTLNGPEIMSKFVGEAEKKLRQLFEDASKNAPSIIFIDELDAIAPKREESYGEVERRVVAQLLASMDGMKNRGRVIVIAATNRPDALDPALRRSGRFDREIEIGVPNRKGREQILKIHTRNMPIKHYAPQVVGKILINHINLHEERSVERIELNKSKIEQQESKIEQQEELLRSLYEQLRDLNKEKQIQYEDSSFIQNILNKIHNKKKDIEKIKDSISKTELSTSHMSQEIKKIKKDIIKIKDINKKLKSDKVLLRNLNKEIDIIMQNIYKLDFLDPRSIFAEEILKKKGDKIFEIIIDLHAAEVISTDFYNAVDKESTNKLIDYLAHKTYGFVGADLEGLAKEAAMNVIKRVIPEYKETEKFDEDLLKKLIVKKGDFDAGLKMVQPSAMREVLVDIPNILWDDVGGLEKAKQELQEVIEWPLKNPESFVRMGIKPPKGVLLYGPPGTGKTLLAKAVATESGVNFISVKGPEVINKWVGESEKAIRKIFAKARQVSPSIIFFDEIDAIASERRATSMSSNTDAKVVNQILTEMDGMEDMKDVMVLAATNRPELIDTALMRPGRFDRHIYIPSPDEKGREKIFNIHTRGMPIEKSIILKDLAKKTVNYSGADIEAVCREAAMLTLRENMKAKEVKNKHFDAALKEIQGSLRKADVSRYENAIDSAKKGTKCDTAPDYMG